MRIVAVAPTRREARALGQHAFVSGTGQAAGERMLSYFRSNPVDALLIAGVCGGLDPSLSPGALILSRSVIAPNRPTLVPNASLLELVRRVLRNRDAAFVSSALITLERPAGTRAEKLDVWNQYGAAGVDMETYAIVEAAEAGHIPWLAVRAVLDPASSSLPLGLRSLGQQIDESEIRRRFARRPQDWPAYGRLAWQELRAVRALRQCWPSIVSVVSSITSLDDRDLRDSRQTTNR